MTTLVIGSYTGQARGSGTGLRVIPGGTAAVPSPSYAISDGTYVYAVHEVGDGSVGSYRLTDAGDLEPVSVRATGGAAPCHLALHDGYLLVANYDSGSVAVFPVADGVLGEQTDLARHHGSGPDPERQQSPHAHQIAVSPDGTVVVVDLGLDQLIRYALVAGRLSRLDTIEVPAGSGPRHVVMHPDGRWFVSAELGAAVLTINAGRYATRTPATGSRQPSQPSAIALSPDHRYLYLANRGPDTVSTYRVGDRLSLISEVPTGGRWPRDLIVRGRRMYVANEKSDSVVAFTIGADGTPAPTGEVIETGSPTSVLVL